MALSARLLTTSLALFAVACGSPTTTPDGGTGGGTATGGGSATGGGAATGGSGGGSNTAAINAFCTQYAADSAKAGHDCLGGPTDLWLDANPCGEVLAGINRGRFTFNEANVAACHAAFSGATLCAEVRDGTGPVADACARVFTGTVALGGGCAAATDCAGAHVRCDTSSTCPGVCKAVSTPGGTCNGPDDCTSNYCNNGVCGAATVSTIASLGQSCTGNVVCDRGLTCDGATMLCRALLREGASCTGGEGKCEFFTSCVGGVCTRWGQLGAACDTSGSEYRGCLGATNCATTTCVALKADGASCAMGNECEHRQCTNGVCAGAPCLESK
jgi:hypothetical protein